MIDGPFNVYDLVRNEVTIRCVSRELVASECDRLNAEAEREYGDVGRFEVRHAEGLPVD